MSTDQRTVPVACNLDRAALAARRDGDIATLLAAVTEARELGDGYELTLPSDAANVRNVTEFIIAERECCRFFTFETTFTPEAGSIILRIRGPEGTKQLLAQMGLLRPTPTRRARVPGHPLP